MSSPEAKRYFWSIDITNWGTLFAFGTEAEAEEWRVHKALWERGGGSKTRVSPGPGAECLTCLRGPHLPNCETCAARDTAVPHE